MKSFFTGSVFLFCCIVLFPGKSFSQLGIKGGLVLSGYQPHGGDRYIMGDDYRPFLGYELDWLQEDHASPDLGFQLGLTYKQQISSKISLQPELYYAQRGVNFIHREQYNLAYYLNVNYLQFPLLCRYDFKTSGKVVPGLMTGPYASLKLNSNRKLDNWGEHHRQKVEGLSRWDYGWALAITTDWQSRLGQIIAELKIDYGLGNTVFQPNEHTPIYEDEGKVRVIAISLMIGYRLEK